VRPGNSWDLRSCRQQPGESLREYIRRFSKQRTELPNITDSDVIGAFLAGTTCRDLVSKLGRKTLTKASELMDRATKFASGQEAVEAIFRKDKQPQGRQKEDAPEASAQRGTKKKAKKKAQAKRDAVDVDLVAAAEHRNPRKPPRGVNTFDKAVHFSASNNVAEYEALVNGLRIVVELGVRRLDARGDSHLVIDQVMKNSHCRDQKMEAYCDEVRRLEDKFYGLELNHVARRYNKTADELAKIASGRTTVPPNVFSRDIYQPSVKLDDAPEPDETSAQPEVPSAAEGDALRIEGERNGVAPNQNW
jgi:ribonuclease HI